MAAKNDTIAKKDKALQLSDLAIKTAQDDASKAYTELQKAQDSANSLWRNPFLWVSVGIIGGILVRGLAK